MEREAFQKVDDRRDDWQGGGSHHKEDEYYHDRLSYGCRGVQLFSVSANFDIDGINIYDWHGGQPIHRRHLLGEEPSANQPSVGNRAPLNKLSLIGPNRAIIPYASPKLEIFRSTDVLGQKGKTTTPIKLVWSVYDYDNDYDDPIILNKEIDGELPHEKISITYMLIPTAVQVKIEVSVMLGRMLGRGDYNGNVGYNVSGFIKAYNEEMEDNYVELLSTKHKTSWVPRGKMTEIPIVSLVCLPRKDLEVYVFLNLKPPLGQQEELGPLSLAFNPRVQTQERQFNNHQIKIKVIFR